VWRYTHAHTHTHIHTRTHTHTHIHARAHTHTFRAMLSYLRYENVLRCSAMIRISKIRHTHERTCTYACTKHTHHTHTRTRKHTKSFVLYGSMRFVYGCRTRSVKSIQTYTRCTEREKKEREGERREREREGESDAHTYTHTFFHTHRNTHTKKHTLASRSVHTATGLPGVVTHHMVEYTRTFLFFLFDAELLDYLHVVTKNQSEKVMTKIVDFVSGSPDMDFLEK